MNGSIFSAERDPARLTAEATGFTTLALTKICFVHKTNFVNIEEAEPNKS